MQAWVTEELQTADFNDVRLQARFRLLLDRMSLKPSLKFTAACRGRAEVKAAYNFVNHSRVTLQSVLAPHRDASLARIREQPVVILAQDTTDNDLTRPHQQVEGSGPLGDDGRFGFFVHPLLALTPEHVPLGVVWVKAWARDAAEPGKTRQQKKKENRAKPIEEKESFKWLEGYRQACLVAAECPATQVICVGDSESDVFELYYEPQINPGERTADWIARACEDRRLGPLQGAQPPVGKLFTQVASAPVRMTVGIEVSRRDAKSHDGQKRKGERSARKAVVSVQAARVRLRQPERPGGRKMADVEVNCVLLREVDPPAGEPAIEWLLLTSLPISTAEQVWAVVSYYCCRWQIEIYFRVLKSGCQVEASQLRTDEAYLAYLGVCLIVAWRVMQLMMLGRECPEMPCDCVLEPEEWQAVYAVVKQQVPPEQPPPLGEMVRLIAGLGGYLGRKGDPPPGPKAMWLGMQRMADLALAWQASHLKPAGPPQGASGEPLPGPQEAPAQPPAPTVQTSGER
jgi:hypothetical protein